MRQEHGSAQLQPEAAAVQPHHLLARCLNHASKDAALCYREAGGCGLVAKNDAHQVQLCSADGWAKAAIQQLLLQLSCQPLGKLRPFGCLKALRFIALKRCGAEAAARLQNAGIKHNGAQQRLRCGDLVARSRLASLAASNSACTQRYCRGSKGCEGSGAIQELEIENIVSTSGKHGVS